MRVCVFENTWVGCYSVFLLVVLVWLGSCGKFIFLKEGAMVPSLALLVALYVLQGLVTGLATGFLPFMLSGRISYSQQAIVSLAAYPYSLKLFWSPIVDVVHVPRWGRRKSWIVPCQILISCFSFLGLD